MNQEVNCYFMQNYQMCKMIPNVSVD